MRVDCVRPCTLRYAYSIFLNFVACSVPDYLLLRKNGYAPCDVLVFLDFCRLLFGKSSLVFSIIIPTRLRSRFSYPCSSVICSFISVQKCDLFCIRAEGGGFSLSYSKRAYSFCFIILTQFLQNAKYSEKPRKIVKFLSRFLLFGGAII